MLHTARCLFCTCMLCGVATRVGCTSKVLGMGCIGRLTGRTLKIIYTPAVGVVDFSEVVTCLAGAGFPTVAKRSRSQPCAAHR